MVVERTIEGTASISSKFGFERPGSQGRKERKGRTYFSSGDGRKHAHFSRKVIPSPWLPALNAGREATRQHLAQSRRQ